jgi:SOS-response transcriptional repressor LexA
MREIFHVMREPTPDDCGTAYFVFKRTKEAAPGDVVVVVRENCLTVRRFELQVDGQVCLRSVEPACPTWIVSADDVKVQGVVVDWGIDLHDSGWA